MKILYVCNNFVYGGVEQYILNVLDHIDRSRYQIDVLLPEGEYERETDLKIRDVHILKYGRGSTKYREFRAILKKERYDIVHFHTGHESAALVLHSRLAGCRKIVVHGHTSQTGDENQRPLHVFCKKMIYMAAHMFYSRYSKRVACSDLAAGFMFGETAVGKVEILKNGIDLDRFRISADRERPPYSFCINARFDPQKNPVFVIDVMSELVKRLPDATLEWIGSGPMREAVEARINEKNLEDHVNLLGTRPDVETVLSRNRYFLLPSLYEGLGIVVIEAQAAGMTCFLSDEVPKLADCGGCITIPLAKNAEQWADQIVHTVLTDEYRCTDENMLNQYNIHNTVKRLECLYEEL